MHNALDVGWRVTADEVGEVDPVQLFKREVCDVIGAAGVSNNIRCFPEEGVTPVPPVKVWFAAPPSIVCLGSLAPIATWTLSTLTSRRSIEVAFKLPSAENCKD